MSLIIYLFKNERKKYRISSPLSWKSIILRLIKKYWTSSKKKKKNLIVILRNWNPKPFQSRILDTLILQSHLITKTILEGLFSFGVQLRPIGFLPCSTVASWHRAITYIICFAEAWNSSHPPTSLAPHDFCLFLKLKISLKASGYENRNEII